MILLNILFFIVSLTPLIVFLLLLNSILYDVKYLKSNNKEKNKGLTWKRIKLAVSILILVGDIILIIYLLSKIL